MTTEFDVRRALPVDARALAELRWALKQEDEDVQGPPDAAAFPQETESWIRDRLFEGRWLAWVVETAGVICGHVFLQPVERMPDPAGRSGAIGYVTNFYVTPDQRNRGIGTALLRALAEHARAGAFETLVVWPSERSATIYQRAGFRTPDELVELPLHP